MPPKQKISKDLLLAHAFAIAEESGINSVTSRSVAKRVGCSIRPVFSHFATMEELRQATFDYTCDVFEKETQAYEQYPDFSSRVTMWVINLARHRPNLYRLVYLSDTFRNKELPDAITGFQVNEKILQKMVGQYELPRDTCNDILQRTFLLLYGAATMVCVNHAALSNEQIASMINQSVSDMVQSAKCANGENEERG